MDFLENEAAQARYFETAETGYRRASVIRHERIALAVAGVRIDLHFASAPLADVLLPALRHLRVDDAGAGELSIGLWDQASSGVAIPRPPFNGRRYTDRGDIWGFTSERFRVAFQHGEFSVNLFDRQARRGLFWVEDPTALPYWTHAAPLRALLHWCMELTNRQLLHAAAVGTASGAVVLTGPGGIGKSSSSLAALKAGMRFAGDDYIVASLHPEPRVHTLYCSAKVNRDQLAQHPALRPWLRNPVGGTDEKAIFDLLPAHAAQLMHDMPIRAICVPEFGDGPDSRVTPDLDVGSVRRAASLTTVEQLPYAGRDTYRFIEALTQRVPAFRLHLGTDRTGVATALAAHLDAPATTAQPIAPTPPEALPSVSVIIPAFNRAHLIGDTIANVLAQGHPGLELIVVDDGSTDGTAAMVERMSGVRLCRQANRGPASARNRGIVNAHGEYIACLDSDDLWAEPGMLLHLVDILERDRSCDVAMGWAQLARIQASGDDVFDGNPREGFPDYISGTVFRRDVFARVGLFNADLRFGEDTEWFDRARESGAHVVRVECTSVIVRRHLANMTRGKNLVQLNALRLLKQRLDQQRLGAADA